MKIKLSPVRSDETLAISKSGDSITINGITLNFGSLVDGATLPAAAIGCAWVHGPVERVNGELMLTVAMPHGALASEQSRFPSDIVNPPDGCVQLPTDFDPKPESPEPTWPAVVGAIDWTKVITREMKEEAAAARQLASVVAETAVLRAAADSAIAPLQDAVDIGDATDDEVLSLNEWKKYRVALNRLPDQLSYPTDIEWPITPV